MSNAVLTRETAITDIQRRGRSDHPYSKNLDVVVPLRRTDGRTFAKAAAIVVTDLTVKRSQGRELSTISTRAGLPILLDLLRRGYRDIALTEVAAICSVSLRTAQTLMAELRAANVLWRSHVGVKGESVTRYALGPVGAYLLDEALSTVRSWQAAKAAARERFRRSIAKSAKIAHRVSPYPQRGGPIRQSIPPVMLSEPDLVTTTPDASVPADRSLAVIRYYFANGRERLLTAEERGRFIDAEPAMTSTPAVRPSVELPTRPARELRAIAKYLKEKRDRDGQ